MCRHCEKNVVVFLKILFWCNSLFTQWIQKGLDCRIELFILLVKEWISARVVVWLSLSTGFNGKMVQYIVIPSSGLAVDILVQLIKNLTNWHPSEIRG